VTLHTVHIVNAVHDYPWWMPKHRLRADMAPMLNRILRERLDRIEREALERYYGETK